MGRRTKRSPFASVLWGDLQACSGQATQIIRCPCISPDAQPLLDDEARRTFVESLDENFCVSAGAGVGKTTAITRRIANLALRRHQEGNVLSRLVVVTYGKLAAEELRVRTRDLVLQHLDKSAHGRQNLLADLRGAFFGTIHSFCLKLIREQGRFLGLPETVDLLEERDEAALWERFCEGGAVDALALPAHLLARVTRHLSFEQICLTSPARSGPEVSEASGVFRSRRRSRPRSTSLPRWTTTADAPRTARASTNATCETWITEFEGGAPFVELPEYTGGSKAFLAAVGCGRRTLRAMAQRGGRRAGGADRPGVPRLPARKKD